MPTAKMIETMSGLLLNCVTRDGKVIVHESFAEDRRACHEGPVTEKGLESSPTLICVGICLKTTRALVGGSVRERGGRGTPSTAGSAETERRERMRSVRDGIHAGAAKVITDIAKYALGKG
jgi:hypothetical protein